MAVGTAEQIRTRPILVRVPNSELEIECRRPDPLALIAHNVLPLDIFAGVLERIAQWTDAGEALTSEIGQAVIDAPKAWGQFIDRWVCAAAVRPQVVLTEADARDVPDALWIDELEYELKMEIFAKTARGLRSPRVGVAVRDFRRLQQSRAAAGPDGAPVREETVGVAAGD
jgi:hypothetical protein